MIERLEELTMGQFIDLICGKTNVLADKEDNITAVKSAIALRNIVMQYREIADPGGSKNYIATVDEYVKAKMSAVIFAMCDSMIKLDAYGNAREVLLEYGIRADRMDNKRLAAEIKSRLNKAKKTISEIENDNSADNVKASDIRAQFDKQTAAIMAYFKFQIDLDSMKATIFAHLVARYNREIKIQLASIQKKK